MSAFTALIEQPKNNYSDHENIPLISRGAPCVCRFGAGRRGHQRRQERSRAARVRSGSYFTDGKPVKGSPQFTASYKGATYQFASAEHKQQFESSPAKYEPQFGGFCGYAASINKLAPIEVQYFQVLHDRLILQHNEKAWKLWHQDVEGNVKKADANWPTLSQQKPPAS